ncbi:hypothetical protein BsWGS_09385 [Bradybaena similaris]
MAKTPKQPSQKGTRKTVVEDTLLMQVVQRYFKLAGVVSLVWLVGYCKFSVSWLWLLLVVFVWKEKHTKAKRHKISISQEIARNEKDVILARVEDLPSWVNFPDVERAEWVNKILSHMWPYIGEYVEKILRESVEPTVKASLPASLQSFKFTQIDLGDIPPRVGGVKVYSKLRRDEIYMDLELNYSSDSKIEVSVKGVTAGIKDLRIHGTLRVIFKPLINKVPLIGGILVYFLNNPDLDFDLTSLANAFDLPGLSDMLHSSIGEQIANFMVLPNRFPIKLVDGLDLNKLRYPLPQGVVRIRVIEAKDLIKADLGLTGKGKSDPYCKIRVGACQVKTRVINNTLAPVWNQTFEMIVDSADGQFLFIEMFDEDQGNKDDELGRVSFDLAKLKEKAFVDEWLPLEDVKHGMIHIQLTWLWLVNQASELDQVLEENKTDEPASTAILLVFLDSARNLPRGKKSLSEPCPQAILSVGQQKEESAIKYSTIEPRWEQNFRFLLHNPNYQNLELELKDGKTKKVIGSTVIKLKDLLVAEDMVMDQKFRIKTREEGSSVHMRLCMRILTRDGNSEWIDNDEVLVEEIPDTGSSVDGKGPQSAAQKPEALPNEIPAQENNGKTSPARATSPTGSLANEANVSPTKAGDQESELRQRKVASSNGTGKNGLGRIQMTFRYSPQRERLVIVVHKCINLKPVEGDSKNLADPYVKMYLLPDKSSSSKRRTKVFKDNLNPVFDETFEYPVAQHEIPKRQLWISVKNEIGFMSRTETEMGQALLDLSTLDLTKAITEWFDLSPENSLKPSSFETDI